jgi:hypothetical protein
MKPEVTQAIQQFVADGLSEASIVSTILDVLQTETSCALDTEKTIWLSFTGGKFKITNMAGMEKFGKKKLKDAIGIYYTEFLMKQ